MRYLSIGLLTYFLFLNGGCSKPPPLTSLSLAGEYEGVYKVIHNWSDSTSEFTNWNYVLWTFDDESYHFRIDSTRHTGHCFCAVTGWYTMQEGVRLEVTSAVVDNLDGCRHCDESEAPTGEFVRETKGDSLILHRQADTVFMELRLLRIN